MEPIAVSVAEAAALLSLSQRSIRRYCAKGRIRTVRVGRRVLVPLESLHRLVHAEAESGAPVTIETGARDA